MLQLKNITKRYEAGEFSVDALKGISLDFRKSDFVSILGPSGCGKTTMLNIIGGLDKYTDGDLVINGKSTKNFSARDWDAYRNHSIGFVFQSYNLIPHQTVLQNVELALALSGVKKAERVARAKAALDSVGLKGLYKKRPREMSGGQMQRVAIARAIVNNPDIILADEPTGALDTETSIQVMEILKEISKDRLVVMVTHNPDLAEKYSTRIVRMLDGLLVDDSAPLSEEELQQEAAADQAVIQQEEAEKADKKHKKKKRKPRMSLWTAFMLSLKNLVTKRGRTVLTSFAGSIGIIGIALIFAVSQGTTNYIAAVQENTLASYPLTIEQTHTDMSSLFSVFMNSAESGEPHDKDAVYEKLALYNLTKSITEIDSKENNLKKFKEYLDGEMKNPDSTMAKSLNGIHYNYNLDLHIYTDNNGTVMRSDTTALMQKMIADLYGVDISTISFTGGGLMGALMSTSTNISSLWQEMLPAPDGSAVNKLIKDQYNLVYGDWPKSGSEGRNQVLLVVDENYEVDDMTLYALGLKSEEDIENIISAARDPSIQLPPPDKSKYSFEEICSKKYKVIFNFELYDKIGDTWQDVSGIQSRLDEMYHNANVGMDLEVVGIIAENPKSSSHMLSGGICYTQELTRYVIERAHQSPIVLEQQNATNKDRLDVVSGLLFSQNNLSDEEKVATFKQYVQGISDSDRAQMYITIHSLPDMDSVMAKTGQLMQLMQTQEDQAFRQYLFENYKYTLYELLSGASGNINMAMVENIIFKIEPTQLQGLVPVIAFLSVHEENAAALKDPNAYTTAELSQMLLDDVFGKDTDSDGVIDVAGFSDAICLACFNNDIIDFYSKLYNLDQSQQGALNGFSQTSDIFKQIFNVMQFSKSTYSDNLVKFGCLDLDNPNSISLYAVSFKAKEDIEKDIANYNSAQTNEEDQIRYTDFIGIIMKSVTTIVNAITYVLIAFVSISLIVSSIMIGVITLISVQERTKEIGILRALGASKHNVSSMFNAETGIIGFIAGLLGVVVTYILTLFVNLILHKLTGITTLNAVLPVWAAALLVGISMVLTLIAGIIPSASAAKKDPVVALRTE